LTGRADPGPAAGAMIRALNQAMHLLKRRLEGRGAGSRNEAIPAGLLSI